MKTNMKFMLTVLALGASAFLASAQDNNDAPKGDGPRGPGMGGHRPPPPPVITALDVNHDGVIDANEIANASAALKKLDKNGDGKLTREELRPQRPPQSVNGDSDDHRPSGPPPGDQ